MATRRTADSDLATFAGSLVRELAVRLTECPPESGRRMARLRSALMHAKLAVEALTPTVRTPAMPRVENDAPTTTETAPSD